MGIISLARFLLEHGGPVGYMKRHSRLLMTYARAWEKRDIQGILDHFHDDFRYRDPVAAPAIRDKQALRRHLERVFARFPDQKWTGDAMLYPHYTAGRFAVYYEFELGGPPKSFSGSGMERIAFRGDKLAEDLVHLHFDQLDYAAALGLR